MGFFDKMNRPEFLKEDSDVQIFIDKMNLLKEKASDSLKEKIEREIKFSLIGKYGEDNIAFELKNSGMPMYILRDIHIEHNDLSAQIDYIVITRKICFFIECKNLIGDIEIDNAGNFIRSYVFNGKKIKEGIYSPITQNQRHLEIYKQILSDKRSNFMSKMLFEKYFDNFNKSIVVLANPKTILNAKYAPKDVKSKVIRADQLVKHIKIAYNQSNENENNDKQLREWADKILALHTPSKSDYAKKYEDIINLLESNEVVTEVSNEKVETVIVNTATEISVNDSESRKDNLIQKLKEFRLSRSREEKIKPYFIFNDKQMMDLLEKMPGTKAELTNVQGFGEAKADKYGDEILRILAQG